MERWLRDGELVGLPDMKYVPGPNRGLSDQRLGSSRRSYSLAMTRPKRG